MDANEFDKLWNENQSNDKADLRGHENAFQSPSVTYTPRDAQLDFGQLPPYTAEKSRPETNRHGVATIVKKKNKRTKWIAVTIIVVAVCIVVAVLGSVLIVTVHSSGGNKANNQQSIALHVTSCDQKPCQNGGSCIGGSDLFHCHCRAGFTGDFCETDINECRERSCANNGTCIDGINMYTCQCLVGFTGLHCETDILECNSSPCANGGTCVEGAGLYTCACAKGFNGTRCETVDDKAFRTCPQHFLHHREWGRCYLIQEDPNHQLRRSEAEDYCQQKGAHLASLETEDEIRYVATKFTWLSKDHHIGAKRAFQYGLIYWQSGVHLPSTNSLWWENEPRISMMCVVLVYRNDYYVYLKTRDCDDILPFVCERADIHPSDKAMCASSPCYNGGICRNVSDSYMCVCAPGYSGRQCESGPFYNCPHLWALYRPMKRCYLLEDDSSSQRSWNDAHEICEMRQGTLASLETSDEVQFIGSQITWQGRHHFLSGRKEPDGQYHWSTGQIVSSGHSEWAEGEPSANRECVSVIMRNNITRLYSADCDTPRPFVCERPIL